MSFWDEHAAAEQALRDQWLDVPPALCLDCDTFKRTVLFGSCRECFDAWERGRNLQARPQLEAGRK